MDKWPREIHMSYYEVIDMNYELLLTCLGVSVLAGSVSFIITYNVRQRILRRRLINKLGSMIDKYEHMR